MSKIVTQEEFEDRINILYKNRFSVIGIYINAHTKIDLKCNVCGYIISNTPNQLKAGWALCPICNPKKTKRSTIVGVNDMWTTNPNVAELLKYSDDGYSYRINTSKKLLFKCPDCGSEKYCLPSNIKTEGFSCNYCSDGISYPNKFIRNLFNLLNVDFIPEYKIKDAPYYFDLFFVYKNKKYIVEMDGGYGHGFKDIPNMSKEKSIEIDKIKNDLCQKNNIDIIRINCNYKNQFERKNFVINNILSSKLSILFDLTNELLNQVDILSQKSNVLLFLELWNSGCRSYKSFKEKLNIKTNTTIRTYAKQCIFNGLLNITYDDFIHEMHTCKI